MSTDDFLMTEKEMAAYLRIQPRQLFNWRSDGLIPFIRIGRAIRYRRSEVDKALDLLSRHEARKS